MASTSASKAIEKFRATFAAYGLPETLVSDNGSQFTSAEFADFLSANGVKHVRTPPYHAASNGAAERMVQTVKRALLNQVLEENASDSHCSFRERVDKFLCAYRNTPSTVTGQSPAQLFLKRQPRTKLSLLKPDFGNAMRDKQERVEEHCDQRGGAERLFRVGGRVYVKTVRGVLVPWQEAVVTQVVSAVTYVVKVHNQFRFVHADHLRSLHAGTSPKVDDVERQENRIPLAEPAPSNLPMYAALVQPVPGPPASPPVSPPHEHRAAERPMPPEAPTQPEGTTPISPPATGLSSPKSPDNQALRRSTRVRKPPDRFQHADFRK
ncbi:hypothetical protein MTO96_042621 [Rhipicephalus appendiculatus]